MNHIYTPLLPHRHRSKYRTADSLPLRSVWWQWLGRIFFHRVTEPTELTAEDALHHAIAILGSTAEVRLRQSKHHTVCTIGTISASEPFKVMATAPTWREAVALLHQERARLMNTRRNRVGALKQ